MTANLGGTKIGGGRQMRVSTVLDGLRSRKLMDVMGRPQQAWSVEGAGPVDGAPVHRPLDIAERCPHLPPTRRRSGIWCGVRSARAPARVGDERVSRFRFPHAVGTPRRETGLRASTDQLVARGSLADAPCRCERGEDRAQRSHAHAARAPEQGERDGRGRFGQGLFDPLGAGRGRRRGRRTVDGVVSRGFSAVTLAPDATVCGKRLELTECSGC